MKKILVALALLLGAAPFARAAAVTAGQNITSASAGSFQPAGPGQYTGNLVNEAGLTYSATYLLDMSQYYASQMSAQAFYTSTTFSNASVSAGHTSSGTVTVVDYTKLSSAAATNSITVTTNVFGATLPTVTIRNCSLLMGRDYSRGATRNATATNLAAAITACNPLITAGATGNIVYTTATYGSYANLYAFSSDHSSITVAASKMSGGRDNACLTINATSICANANFQAVTSSVTTAANIVTAINANSTLSAVVVATSNFNTGAAYGNLTVASLFNGTAYNYAFTSSTPTALTVKDGSLLIGGTNSGFTLSSAKITASAAPGYTVGLPILWAIGSNPAIGGLTTGTTYYVVPAGGNSVYLAKYATSAVAGLSADYATVTSTSSGSTTYTYTLAPLAITGTPGFKWQVSNDNSNWDDLAVSSVTVSSYSIPPAVTSWGFGTLGYRYIRLNVTGPSTGGLYLKVPVQLNR